MEDLGQYILTVGLAALLAGIIADFSDPKSASGSITRTVCGLFLAFTVINPLTDLNFGILESFSRDLDRDVQPVVSAGTGLAEESMGQIIKEETQAYILDKARSLGCSLEAEVILGEGEVPVPESVCITGSISAQNRKQLEEILERELGISKEKQQWIG